MAYFSCPDGTLINLNAFESFSVGPIANIFAVRANRSVESFMVLINFNTKQEAEACLGK